MTEGARCRLDKPADDEACARSEDRDDGEPAQELVMDSDRLPSSQAPEDELIRLL